MSKFLVIECDERLNPSQTAGVVPFQGTHAFSADDILRVTITALKPAGSRVIVMTKAGRGATTCHTLALGATVLAQLHALTTKDKL